MLYFCNQNQQEQKTDIKPIIEHLKKDFRDSKFYKLTV